MNTCPVCGYAMDYPAADFHICPSCGTEFGYDDSGIGYPELRQRWLESYLRKGEIRNRSRRMTPTLDQVTREEWLENAVLYLGALFDEAGAELPPQVRVSCGFPSRGALSKKNKTIGECWNAKCSEDGSRQIFISPLLVDSVEVLATLVHEMAHACLKDGVGHKKPFKKLCDKLGLEGPAKANWAGPQLKIRLQEITQKIGTYPHAKLLPLEKIKKQSTRMLKISCVNPEKHEQSIILRGAAKAFDKGLPKCWCGNEFFREEEEGEEE